MPTGFELAKKSFAENRDSIGEPMKNPSAYNLNNGLHALVSELDKRLSEIERLLRSVATAQRR